MTKSSNKTQQTSDKITQSVLEGDIESFDKAIEEIHHQGILLNKELAHKDIKRSFIEYAKRGADSSYITGGALAKNDFFTIEDFEAASPSYAEIKTSDGFKKVQLHEITKQGKEKHGEHTVDTETSYFYDDKQNLTRISRYYYDQRGDFIDSESYSYDSQKRLISASNSFGETIYSYPKPGVLRTDAIFDGMTFIYANDNLHAVKLTAKGTIPEAMSIALRPEARREAKMGVIAEIRFVSNYLFKNIVGEKFLDNSYELDGEEFKLVHVAASRGDYKMLKRLLEEGAAIDSVDSKGNSLLHYVVENGTDLKGIKYIADRVELDEFNIPNDDKKTPLKLAIEKGNLGLLEYLDQREFNFENPLKGRVDKFIMTPATYACIFSTPEVVEFFLDKKIVKDVNVIDFHNRTLLDYAKEAGNEEVVNFLIGRGATASASVQAEIKEEGQNKPSTLPDIFTPVEFMELDKSGLNEGKDLSNKRQVPSPYAEVDRKKTKVVKGISEMEAGK